MNIIHQHRKPICDTKGVCIGHTDWQEGKGLDSWPHRKLCVVEITGEKSLKREDVEQMAREADSGFGDGEDADGTMPDSIVGIEAVMRFAEIVAAAEREKVCAAIKEEDDYCVDEGDYMLDSNDCIAVARGQWQRPDFSTEQEKSNKLGKLK